MSKKDAWVSREAQPSAYCELTKGVPQLSTAAHGAGHLELLRAAPCMSRSNTTVTYKAAATKLSRMWQLCLEFSKSRQTAHL